MASQISVLQTAPVDEFRIFWTTQKKQKRKRWQDGYLRFHAFNKKMIVYDETRTHVCEMYLQQAPTVNEGDEFEFENHLVTVEEFIGRVIQDLASIMSPIIERRKQKQLHAYNQPGKQTLVRPNPTDQPLQPVTTRLPIGGLAGVEHVSLAELLKRSGGQPSNKPSKPTWQNSSGPGVRPGITLLTPENVQVAHAQSAPEESNLQPGFFLFNCPTNEAQIENVAEAAQTVIDAADPVSQQTNSSICPKALLNAQTSDQASVQNLHCYPSQQTYVRIKGISQPPTHTTIPLTAPKTQNVQDGAMKNIHSALPSRGGLSSIARKRALENLPTTTIRIRTPKRSMLICNKVNENVNRLSQVTLKGDGVCMGKKKTARLQADPDLEKDDSYNLLNSSDAVGPGFLSHFRNVEGRIPSNNSRGPSLGINTYVKYSHLQSPDQEPLQTSSSPSSLGISPSGNGHPVEKSVCTVQMEGSYRQTTEDSTSSINISKQERFYAQVITTTNAEDVVATTNTEGKPKPTICSGLPAAGCKLRIRKEKEQSGEAATIGLTQSFANEKESGPWSIEAFDLFQWRPPA